MFMILNKDEGAYLYNVDISAASYRLTNNANKADKFTLNEANRIINILKKYNFDNLTTSEFLDSKCKDVNPHEGESKEDFMARFMSETKEEYPDEKQRLAVANSYWERKDVKDSSTHDSQSTYTIKYKNSYGEIKFYVSYVENEQQAKRELQEYSNDANESPITILEIRRNK